jgi:hypothetical protein
VRVDGLDATGLRDLVGGRELGLHRENEECRSKREGKRDEPLAASDRESRKMYSVNGHGTSLAGLVNRRGETGGSGRRDPTGQMRVIVNLQAGDWCVND